MYWTSIKTMLLYLGYVENTWEKDIDLDVELAKRLKDFSPLHSWTKLIF